MSYSERPLDFAAFLLELSEKADAALAAHDYGASVKYHQAMATAVPDRALPFSRLCQSQLALGQAEAALGTCRTALTLEGVQIEDFERFAEVMLQKAELSAEQIGEFDLVIAHLEQQLPSSPSGWDLACQLGVKLKSQERLDQCIRELARLAPDDPRTITYQWSLSMIRGDHDEASRLVQRAKQSGMRPEGIAQLIAATHTGSRAPSHWTIALFAALAFALIGLGTWFRLNARRRRTLHTRATAV